MVDPREEIWVTDTGKDYKTSALQPHTLQTGKVKDKQTTLILLKSV